ncbi:allantoinase [Schizophyllum commune H4-8]|uniref:allantoinase n=1 Tax=Schizophyllum commune (strain H4-8 / FGSC 9210) TaxID=578458 RepID=D8QC35_SCHCM|nr:allantoinase [Schizophyllum commune H4-8]KAI5889423.1 allantoinase [Schizophyllum commune H4-8]
MRSLLLIVAGRKVLFDDNESPRPATLVINTSTGKIQEIRPVYTSKESATIPAEANARWVDAGDKLVIPGLVDAHVHLNEPGRTDWEGFWTGTRAAASGGVTCVVDMPLNSIPPTTTLENFETKKKAAQGQCFVDVAFWGGVIPGNEDHLVPLVDAGVRGFKCFMIESGVDEFPCVNSQDIRKAMDRLQKTKVPLLFHAELASENSNQDFSSLDPTLYSTFLQSRPQTLESDAIKEIISFHADYPDLRTHVVHLSASSALPSVREAKKAANFTIETCFHYLCLEADDIPHGHPEFKCCPPIREAANREELWAALKDGTIDCVVSDHSPSVAELKCLDDGNIMKAWGGCSSLGLGLSLLWTEASKRGDIALADIVRWTSRKTAEHAGLAARKGQLRAGYDADFVIFDPDASWTVTKEQMNFKNKLSPYEGLTLRGRVEQTWLRGGLAYDIASSDLFVSQPRGQLL